MCVCVCVWTCDVSFWGGFSTCIWYNFLVDSHDWRNMFLWWIILHFSLGGRGFLLYSLKMCISLIGDSKLHPGVTGWGVCPVIDWWHFTFLTSILCQSRGFSQEADLSSILSPPPPAHHHRKGRTPTSPGRDCESTWDLPPPSSTPTCSGSCAVVTPSDWRDSLWLFRGGWLIVAQNTCLAQPALGGIWCTAGLIGLWP